MNIVIIDYGLGNLCSVAGAVRKLGHNAIISNKMSDMQMADKLILPGVGAFVDGMNNLRELNLLEPLNRLVLENKKPILGICLGFQLMAKVGYEFGTHRGIGWIDGSVIKLEPKDTSLRIPHVGWDDLLILKDDILFDGVPKDALFYYTHSFHVHCNDGNDVLGVCKYDQPIHSVYHKGNIYGTQFHPEKSQLHGLTILKNFIEKC